MRYGIMAMQLDALIPTELAPEEFPAYITDFSHATLVRGLCDQGFRLIELGGDLVGFMPQTFAPSQIEALADLKMERGLDYTVHLPLWSVEPSSPLEPIREGSARTAIDVIQATLPLEPEVYVLHATGALAAEFMRMALPATGKRMLLRRFEQAAIRSLSEILNETGIPTRQLSIETIEFPLDLTLEMAELLDLSLCFDVGHVVSGFSGPLDVWSALDACAPRIAEIHLHDAGESPSQDEIIYGQDHTPLGTGDLDVGRFLDELVAMDFDGPIIFELRVDEAKASLDYIREVRPETL